MREGAMGGLFLNYLIEFAMLVPAAVLALMPTKDHLRFRAGIVYMVAFDVIAVFGVAGSFVAMTYGLSTPVILLPGSLLLLVPFWIASTLEPAKKLYCFVNAAMLCAFSTMYCVFVTAPLEVGNSNPVSTIQSGLTCLLIAALVCVAFARTLLVKLPSLFDNESLDNLWKWIVFAPIATTAFIIWITPVSAVNVMFGLMRPKGMAVLLLIVASAWFLHHVAWLAASRTLDSQQLRHENELLKLEEKRHGELLSFIDDARVMRHDFRHHMAVVSELAHSGKSEEAAAYADQFVESSHEKHVNRYCENSAVDAIAAHYDAIAKSRDVTVAWTLDLPSELPVKEVDFCSAFGNLVENAITAAGKCDEGARTVNVKASTFSGNVITLVVENTFTGTLDLGENGLPKSVRDGHGIGLTSVSAIARKYDGNLATSTEGSTFSATMLLYAS